MHASQNDISHVVAPSRCFSSYHSSSRRWKHESRSCEIEITDGLLRALHVSCRIRHIAPGPAAVIRIPLLTSLSTSTGFLQSPAVEQLEQDTFRMPLPKAGFTSEASPHFISSTQLASPVRAVHELEEGYVSSTMSRSLSGGPRNVMKPISSCAYASCVAAWRGTGG